MAKRPSGGAQNRVERARQAEPGKKTWVFVPGPIFAALVLFDEGNRAMPRAKSAVLEPMQNRTVTVSGKTYKVPEGFSVIYTMNPIDQEGVYPLTEAEVDRFMWMIQVKPTLVIDEIVEIGRRMGTADKPVLAKVATNERLIEIGRLSDGIGISPELETYMAHLIRATRAPELYPGLEHLKETIKLGASDRSQPFMMKASRILALMDGRSEVTLSDVKEAAAKVLAHRVHLNFSAGGTNAEKVIELILGAVPQPHGAPAATAETAPQKAPSGGAAGRLRTLLGGRRL